MASAGGRCSCVGCHFFETNAAFEFDQGEGGIFVGNVVDSAGPGTKIGYVYTDRHVVSGNEFYMMPGAADGGYLLVQGNETVITGNQFDINYEAAIRLSGAEDTVIVGNSMRTEGFSTNGAIYILADSYRALIVGNRIESPDCGGIEFASSSASAFIKDNNFNNCSIPIDLGGFTPEVICHTEPFQFIKELNGTYRTASPTGIEIDADTEAAILQGHIPIGTQQVIYIRIHAVALGAPIGAGGQMHLELTFNAGSPNAAYNTAATSWTLANFDGLEADYVANDVVTWLVGDVDTGNELRALAPHDWFELIVNHEAGADPDGATNAVFGSICIEYV